MKEMQKCMDDFCIGTLKVAKNRKYLPPGKGGLGLFNLNDFVTAIQCSWVRRLHYHGVDNWRHDFLAGCYGNPLISNSRTFNYNVNPILHTIATSFEKFYKAYFDIGKNYLKSYVFQNPLMQRDGGYICELFLGREKSPAFLEAFAKLKVEDFLHHRQFKSLDRLNDDFNLNLDLLTYMRLSPVIMNFLAARANRAPAVPVGMPAFICSSASGSRVFRKVICRRETANFNILTIPSVVTFRSITDGEINDPLLLKNCLSIWNFSKQSNQLREFEYKFFLTS
jgi:hypothetical protein